MRRRNNFIAQRTRNNQGYVPNNNLDSSNNNDNDGGIWTTTFSPPAYDNIYESSIPVNPLPEYSSTLVNKINTNENSKPKSSVNQIIRTSEMHNEAYNNQDENLNMRNSELNPQHMTIETSSINTTIISNNPDSNLDQVKINS